MAEQAPVTEATISDDAELDTLREGIDDPMVLKEQLRKESEARRKITARAIKAEEDLKVLRANPPKVESIEITNPTPSNLSDRDYTELRMQGYTADDVADIQKFGGLDALKDPNSVLAQGIRARQEQRKAEEAASGTNLSGGEDQFREVDYRLPRNPSLQDLKKSTSEMEKVFPHAD